MKKLNLIKTVELILLIAFSVYCIYTMRMSPELRTLASENSQVRLLATALWVLIAGVFVMFFIDFGAIAHGQKEFATLKTALHSDVLSQIANRNGCDQLIDRYIDKELPAGFTCVMLMLSNIYEINEKHGRAAGNQAIQDFSVILHMAARNVGFAGRNGGNKFILLFESEQGPSECEQCLARIREKVDEYNAGSDVKLRYAYGQAVSRAGDGRKIHELISYADRSIDTGALRSENNEQKGAKPDNDKV